MNASDSQRFRRDLAAALIVRIPLEIDRSRSSGGQPMLPDDGDGAGDRRVGPVLMVVVDYQWPDRRGRGWPVIVNEQPISGSDSDGALAHVSVQQEYVLKQTQQEILES
jgi:hypothetical protein